MSFEKTISVSLEELSEHQERPGWCEVGIVGQGCIICQMSYHALIVPRPTCQRINDTISSQFLCQLAHYITPLTFAGWLAYSSYLANTKELNSELVVLIHQINFLEHVDDVLEPPNT